MSVRLSDIEFTLTAATVVYTGSNRRRLNLANGSVPQAEVVFKLAHSERELKVDVRNANFSFHLGQEIGILSVGNKIVAYVDMATKNYSFSTENFSRKLRLGISIYWVLIVGVLGGFLVYYFQRERSIIELTGPLACAWLIYTIQGWIYDSRFKNQLDKFLEAAI